MTTGASYGGDRYQLDTCLITCVCVYSDIMIHSAFELVHFKNSREVVFFGTRKSECSVQHELASGGGGGDLIPVKWDVVRYHMDPRGERPVYSYVVYSEVSEEVLGLKYHVDTLEETGKRSSLAVPPVLTISTPNNYLLVFNPLERGGQPPPSLSR